MLYSIETKYYKNGFAFKYNNFQKTYNLMHTTDPNHSTDSYVLVFADIPMKIINGASYIPNKIYNEQLLPLLNK